MKTREKSLPEWVFVATGGAAGALARAGLDALAELFPYSGFLASFMLLPWSTLLANLGGAFFLGALFQPSSLAKRSPLHNFCA